MGSLINHPTGACDRLSKVFLAAVLSFGFALSVSVNAHAQEGETLRAGGLNQNSTLESGTQVADSGLVAVGTTGESSPASFARNPGNPHSGEVKNTGQADNLSLPGSVIALVVALIAVVAVARRDVSGTTHNP
jgi:hypothetical protein